VTAIEELPFPVIAAVEGAALGGGLEIILGCDMRVGSTSSTFGLPETRLGVIHGGGGTVRLDTLVGWGRARQIILTGGRVGGRQAEQWGCLICVNDGAVYAKALEMAREVARGAPLAVRMAKIALRSAERLEKGEALEMERVC
jgi:enoyl-CoA hydratase/carnithine racemase